MAKTVCIVGAGPSGLVAAKSLLHEAPKGAFKVTVFEAQPRIGGLWPLCKDDGGGLVHPLMLANQSKHTMQFSDLAWTAGAPEIPTAWQIGRYLERYLERYCGDVEFHLGSRVERTELLDGDRWKVNVRSDGQEVEAGVFDYLLVSSGYFGSPSEPAGLPKEKDIPVVHSSKYRTLEELLGKAGGSGGKILIVGGQFSGVEIAGTIANHLSSAVNSPGVPVISSPEKYSIHHLIQRPSWVFPLHISPKPLLAAAPFQPLDFPSYNLANRPHPLTDTQGHITVEAGRATHSIYQGILGTDQAEFAEVVTMSSNEQDEPPYLSVSDTYMEHIRSGLIHVSKGRLKQLSGTTAEISPGGDPVTDIAAVILATGFKAATSLAFLPPPVQETLSIRPSDLDNTIALSLHGTRHPSLPTLGFVGFYRSPYWGVMELQSRILAALWSSSPSLPPSLQAALDKDVSLARTVALRTDPRRSQFPMGDYPYLMQDLAAALDTPRAPFPDPPTAPLPHNGKPMDVLTPARYPPLNMSPKQQAENTEALRQTHEAVVAGLEGKRFVPRAVFRSLLGSWELRREITSRLPSHPSGEFKGTARFLLRKGTPDGRSKSSATKKDTAGAAPATEQADEEEGLGQEYLYIEEGTFTATNGLAFPATRRYVWRYDEAREVLSVWFVRVDDSLRADYRFHDIEFLPPPPEAPSKKQQPDGKVPARPPAAGFAGDAVGVNEPRQTQEGEGWRARADHLCEADFYDVRYDFRFRAVNLREWRCGYVVRGPQKDYTIDGVYRRAGVL